MSSAKGAGDRTDQAWYQSATASAEPDTVALTSKVVIPAHEVASHRQNDHRQGEQSHLDQHAAALVLDCQLGSSRTRRANIRHIALCSCFCRYCSLELSGGDGHDEAQERAIRVV